MKAAFHWERREGITLDIMIFYVEVGGHSRTTAYKTEASHFPVDRSVQNLF